jgi:hypothetical protein
MLQTNIPEPSTSTAAPSAPSSGAWRRTDGARHATQTNAVWWAALTELECVAKFRLTRNPSIRHIRLRSCLRSLHASALAHTHALIFSRTSWRACETECHLELIVVGCFAYACCTPVPRPSPPTQDRGRHHRMETPTRRMKLWSKQTRKNTQRHKQANKKQ